MPSFMECRHQASQGCHINYSFAHSGSPDCQLNCRACAFQGPVSLSMAGLIPHTLLGKMWILLLRGNNKRVARTCSIECSIVDFDTWGYAQGCQCLMALALKVDVLCPNSPKHWRFCISHVSIIQSLSEKSMLINWIGKKIKIESTYWKCSWSYSHSFV